MDFIINGEIIMDSHMYDGIKQQIQKYHIKYGVSIHYLDMLVEHLWYKLLDLGLNHEIWQLIYGDDQVKI